jgi:hypothetical protein
LGAASKTGASAGTKTAEKEERDRITFAGYVWISEHDRREKICALDRGRADRG